MFGGLAGNGWELIAELSGKAETLPRTEGHGNRGQGQRIGGEKI
nr:MAG TPA: hypothetical protein [Caudoviricetes sp.]DAG75679.1 MAG TPA: hypothetical protein [Caudoviricetes sp.]DAH86896.1 MAG TPA: hypothetical protein [Bacteriophage sp.]DAQ27061.1 MAG TPA: hypothetical protein [Caudoviricetes sp.]